MIFKVLLTKYKIALVHLSGRYNRRVKLSVKNASVYKTEFSLVTVTDATSPPGRTCFQLSSIPGEPDTNCPDQCGDCPLACLPIPPPK